MAKITIVKTGLNYEWKQLELHPDALEAHVLRTNENLAEDGGNMLLFTETARSEMFDFIQWGNLHTSANRNEQGGLLAGQHFAVPGHEGKVCVATHVFPLYGAAGTSGFLDATAENWHRAYAAMDALSARTGEQLDALGWFHTHPNGLATFMSGTDRATQREIFRGEHSYAVVLNPHTGSWKAYRGPEVLDATCAFLDTNDLSELCGAPAPQPKPAPKHAAAEPAAKPVARSAKVRRQRGRRRSIERAAALSKRKR